MRSAAGATPVSRHLGGGEGRGHAGSGAARPGSWVLWRGMYQLQQRVGPRDAVQTRRPRCLEPCLDVEGKQQKLAASSAPMPRGGAAPVEGPRRRPSLEPRPSVWELALQRGRRRAGGFIRPGRFRSRRRGSCRPRCGLSSELKDPPVHEGAQPSSHNILPTEYPVGWTWPVGGSLLTLMQRRRAPGRGSSELRGATSQGE